MYAMKVAVIGGGAAGFFAAIEAKRNHPQAAVVLFEKSRKLLSKVKISGGGRCNVTNGCTSIAELSRAYPRGSKQLKKAFRTFNTVHTMDWFESRGVALMTQPDNCVFPVSQDSQSIIDCFLKEARQLGVRIETGVGVAKLQPVGEGLKLHFLKGVHPPAFFDKVIVATGGSPKRQGLEWLEALGHQIEDPVPSLFTFNMPEEPVTELMGVVVEDVQASIQGTKLKSDGPLLITHWGMSGPAILKLSAFGARALSELGYVFRVQVNWANEQNAEQVSEDLRGIMAAHPKKGLNNERPYALPKRLWSYLLAKAELPEDKKWSEIGKKGLHKLTHLLTNDVYQVRGKTTFKEEFVTCGGVSLQSIDFKTMQSKACKNLYFAGEVLDIDGITGGYNFQAAWTTAYIAGQLN
jgi:predicted Rossmann fold flavoprotein